MTIVCVIFFSVKSHDLPLIYVYYYLGKGELWILEGGMMFLTNTQLVVLF